jgi:hypothetical protein
MIPRTIGNTAITALSFLSIGVVCNISVELMNFGLMPVFEQGCEGAEGMVIDSRHICGWGATRLAGLSDWIHLGRYIYSPGDIFLAAGQLVGLVCVGMCVVKVAQLVRKKLQPHVSVHKVEND